jgi:hypothetical protein
MSNGRARSLTVAGPRLNRSTMALRVGSARALKLLSMFKYLSINLSITASPKIV